MLRLLPWLLFPALAWSAIPTTLTGRNVVTGEVSSFDLGATEKGTVVVFLSAKCPCSAGHEKVLHALHEEFSSQGFRFVGIHSNQDESSELSRAHFSASQLPFPVIEDPQSRIANQLGALKTPHVFLIHSRQGILFQGGVDDSAIPGKARKHYLKDALMAVRAGRNPDQKEARTLGCIIQR